ncbi:hypothetical protein, partial [Bradyrhizobium canariense]|uniref:hypothetical protein n=1 Tax=Bradyrhizobium canariense TaxID=255045 RepID=UPI000A24F3A1
GKRLPANTYQNAIANAVQRIDDAKNNFGRGKNETNMLAVLYRLRTSAQKMNTPRPLATTGRQALSAIWALAVW